LFNTRQERFDVSEPLFKSSPLSPDAFADILVDSQRPLYAFTRSLVGDEEQARDILQDVFYDAWRAARSGAAPFHSAGDEEGIRRWLFHAAYCDAVSVLRRRRLIRWRSLDAPDQWERERPYEPQAFEDQVVEGEVVRSALASLSPEETATLLLSVVAGYAATEIATLLGISAGAAKKRLSRAKQHLRAAYFNEEQQQDISLEPTRSEES
jgi:RNA polymerase sigma-70 factor (ECF subfamily)